MMIIVACFGRVPATNSCIAWQISGPGISSHFYKRINLSHLPLLINSFLEKEELYQYEKLMINKINEPYENARKVLERVFSSFHGKVILGQPSNLLKTGKLLKKQLDFQLKIRRKKLIMFPEDVRMTKSELEIAISMCKDILERKFYEKELLNKLWSEYKIHEDDWEKMSREILKKIFGKNILECFEELDHKRIELKGTMSEEFQGILESLHGEIGRKIEEFDIEIQNNYVKRINSAPSSSIGTFLSKSFLADVREYVKDYKNSMIINVSNANEVESENTELENENNVVFIKSKCF